MARTYMDNIVNKAKTINKRYHNEITELLTQLDSFTASNSQERSYKKIAINTILGLDNAHTGSLTVPPSSSSITMTKINEIIKIVSKHAMMIDHVIDYYERNNNMDFVRNKISLYSAELCKLLLTLDTIAVTCSEERSYRKRAVNNINQLLSMLDFFDTTISEIGDHQDRIEKKLLYTYSYSCNTLPSFGVGNNHSEQPFGFGKNA